MALLIRPGGQQPEEVFPLNNKTFTLSEIQTLIGGYMEAYRLPNDVWLILNEDGKRLNLEPNIHATVLFNGVYLNSIVIQDVVVGIALLGTTEEMNGPEDDQTNESTEEEEEANDDSNETV
jgi:hypothetical protein